MQVETIKSVGKKKIIGIATAIMLVGGGASAFASQSVQDGTKNVIDSLVNKGVNYYAQNIDTQMNAYAKAEKDSIPGKIAGVINYYSNEIQKKYNNELARGKAEVKAHADAEMKSETEYADWKYGGLQQSITDKVNAKVNQANDEIDQAIQDELAKLNK